MKVLTATTTIEQLQSSPVTCKIISDLKLKLPDTQTVGRMLPPHTHSQFRRKYETCTRFLGTFSERLSWHLAARAGKAKHLTTEQKLFHVSKMYYSVFCKYSVKNSRCITLFRHYLHVDDSVELYTFINPSRVMCYADCKRWYRLIS